MPLQVVGSYSSGFELNSISDYSGKRQTYPGGKRSKRLFQQSRAEKMKLLKRAENEALIRAEGIR